MSFMTEVVNPWLQGHLADTIVNALQDVVHGTEADLREVAVHIAKDLTLALIRGDKEWSAELGEQVRVLFEIKKIRLSKRERALIQRRIWSLATAALKAFMAGTVQGLFQGIAPVDPAGAGVITQARTLLGL